MSINHAEKNEQKNQGGFSWGFAGLVASAIVAFLAALLFVLPAVAGLGQDSSSGAAYAGLAAIFLGGLIFLGAFLALGVIFLIFFTATNRRKAMFVSIGQIALTLILIVLFLIYMAV